MALSIQPAVYSSSQNIEDEMKATLLSSQKQKLCSAICLIISGILLVLGSLISMFALPYLGVSGAILTVFAIPLFVGIVLIVLGICSLHTKVRVKSEIILKQPVSTKKSVSDLDKNLKGSDEKIFRTHPKIFEKALKFDPSLADKGNLLSPKDLGEKGLDIKSLSKRGWR